MNRQLMGNVTFLKILLILQLIPILLFPPSVFELTSQKWWLPAILVVMSIIGCVQVFRKSVVLWPLYLISFAHGFNIISRLLMLMPQTTQTSSFDFLYFVLSVVAMALSALMLWVLELPEARQALVG
jgi:hypothetical protein